MTELYQLVILGDPLPWRAPYVGTRGAYSPRTKVMEHWRDLLRKQWKWPMLVGPLLVTFDFFIRIPKATSRKKRALMLSHELRPTQKPDRDNLAKLLSDVLQDVVYENDSCVVGGRVEKWFGEVARSVITIVPYDKSMLAFSYCPSDYMGNSLVDEVHQGLE